MKIFLFTDKVNDTDHSCCMNCITYCVPLYYCTGKIVDQAGGDGLQKSGKDAIEAGCVTSGP